MGMTDTLQDTHNIQVWYKQTPNSPWMLESEEFPSVEEAKEWIDWLKNKSTFQWRDFAFRVVTERRTFTIDHSE